MLCGKYRILIMFAQHESDMFCALLRFRRYQQNSRNSKGNLGGVRWRFVQVVVLKSQTE